MRVAVKRWLDSPLAPYFFFLVVNLVVYHAVWRLAFAHHDDYPHFASHFTAPFADWWGGPGYTRAGRILSGIFTHFLVNLDLDLNGLRFVRLFFLVVLSLQQWILHRWLLRLTRDREIAITFPVLMAFLPGAQVYLFWTISGAAAIPALLFSTIAIHFLFDPQPHRRWLKFTLGAFFQIVALFFYQPTAMFVFIGLFIWLLYVPVPQRVWWRSYFFRTGLLGAILVAYRFLYSLTVRWMAIEMDSRAQVAGTWEKKWDWFYHDALGSAIQLWSTQRAFGHTFVERPTGFSYVLVFFFVLATIIWLRRDLRELPGFLLRLPFLLLLLPLSYLPNLMVGYSYGAYRTTFVPACFFLFVLVASALFVARHFCKRPGPVMVFASVGMLLLGIYTSRGLYRSVIAPSLSELAEIRRVVKDWTPGDAIFLRTAKDYRNSFGYSSRFDEFAILSSSSPSNPDSMICMVLKEFRYWEGKCVATYVDNLSKADFLRLKAKQKDVIDLTDTL